MDADILKKQLEELEQRFQQWIEPIERIHMVTSYKINKGGYTLNDHKREVKEIARRQIAQYDPYQDMYVLLDQLCSIYLTASSQQRAEIRAAARDKEGIWSGLINYIYRAAERVQSSADKEWLRLGLAAASIEDCSIDFRDTLMALAELYVAAEKASIDPEPDFREVAELSSYQTPSGGQISVNKMLSEFQSYAILEERRSHPELWGEKEEAPWERRIYRYDLMGKYLEESGIEIEIENEKIPWWKHILGLGK